MRAQPGGSACPDRIFELVLDVAKELGMIGKRRAFDSTALFDAVATQDTVAIARNAGGTAAFPAPVSRSIVANSS